MSPVLELNHIIIDDGNMHSEEDNSMTYGAA